MSQLPSTGSLRSGRRRITVLGALALLGACRSVPATVTHPAVPSSELGLSLAADVILPTVVPDTGVPVVLVQARYWRSFQLRGRRNPKVVPMGPRDAVVERLVAAGFGVVVTDVRGTGASDGTWRWPWSAREVADVGAVIDWIVSQRWSNGVVGATGVSYEGTTALLAAAAGRPAVRAVLAREIEWTLADEILAPGQVRNVGFVGVWSRAVDALDHGRVPELYPRLARFGIRGVTPTDDDHDGARLRARMLARPTTDVAASLTAVRRGTDRYGADGPPVDSLGPAGHAVALASTTAAVAVWGSWWDGATADAVLRAQSAMPVVDAVIGPWAHEGTSNASPLRRDDSERPTVDADSVVGWFRRNLVARATPAIPRRTWYVAGIERWRSDTAWPATASRTLHLVGQRLLDAPGAGAARTLAVDFAASTGRNTRWTTGLARPVDAPERASARGLLSWEGAPFAAPFSVFGAAEFRCAVQLDAPEAALHVYVESVDPSHHVRLLTEGVQRISAGVVQVRIRPVAFELPSGWALRVSVAGADASSFERVPATGAQRLQFAGEGCQVTVPVVR